jgi:hypothetical protein
MALFGQEYPYMLSSNLKAYCKQWSTYFTFPPRAFSMVTTPPKAREVPVC